MRNNVFYAVIFLWTIFSSPLFASELIVGTGENAGYATIQSAIDAAKDGDTVIVQPGLYRESLTINKTITLKGDVENTYKFPKYLFAVTIKKLKEGPFRDRQLKIQEDTENFWKNIFFERQYLENQVVVLVENKKSCKVTAPATLESIVFTHNEKFFDFLLTKGFLTDIPSGVRGKRKFEPWTSVNYDESFGLIEVFSDANFTDIFCLASAQFGMKIDSGSPKITECFFLNSARSGIAIFNSAKPEITACAAVKSGLHGLEVNDSANPKILQCRFNTNLGNGIRLGGNSTGTYSSTTLRYNGYDGKNGYDGIGVYDSASPSMISCEVEYSHSAGIIVEGTVSGSYKKITFSFNTQGILIRENAMPSFENCRISGNFEEGVLLQENASIVLRNCFIGINKYTGLLFDDNSSGTVENCLLEKNKNFGILVLKNASPTINKCKLSWNSYSGIMILDNAKGIYKDTEILNSMENGIYVIQDASPTVENCLVKNSKGTGILIEDNAKGSYTNCFSADNGERDLYIAPTSTAKVQLNK